MSELNYDNLLKLVQAGNVDEVDSLLNVSNEEILKSLGMDDKYDALIDAAIFSRNAQMVKVLFKHTDLINKTPDLMKDRLLDADGKEYANDSKVVASESDRENLHQIMDYVNQWEKAEKRANLQSYKGKHTEWQAALKKAQENGFDDLADRIQRRVDFEEQRRLEQEGKRPAGKSVDRWRDEKSWILDGQGRLEYDMYGQDNRNEIIQLLKKQGIAAKPMEDKQKTGGFSNYRIIVQVEDVAKLKEFLQDREDLMAIVSKDNNQVEQTEELSPVTTDFTPDIPEGGPLFTQKDLEEYRRQQKQAQLGVNNSEYPVQKAKTEEQVIMPEVLPPEQPFPVIAKKKGKDKEDVEEVENVVMKEEQPKPTPAEETKQKPQPTVQPQPEVQSTEKLADLTWQRSPLIEDKRGEHNWHFNDKGQIFYNMAGLTAEAREQVQQILASHGVECAENPEEKDALYLAHPQDFKALKRAWGRARQYQEYNQDLLLEPKPKLVEWNSPGFEKYWCQHHTKNMWLDNHPDVSSFNLKPKPYYFNVDGFDASVVKATEQYLKNMNIPFEYTEASEDLKTKDPKDNSIAKGQRVIVVKDKASIQKLHELWNATKRAPELANPPKGMLLNGMSSKEQDVAQPGKGKTGKETPQQPKAPKSTSGLGAAVAKGVGKQLKNVGGTFADTLANFAKNTLAKNFNSPEEFGQEFLYQLMAFPLDWLKAYLDTIAKDEKKDPAQKSASPNNNDDLLKKIGDIQKQAGLSDNGMGNYTPEQHAKRVQALRDFFNAPENAAQREQLKQIAQMVGQNPEAFKPLFEKIFPNAPFGFEEAMQAIGNGNPAQGKVFSAVQPTPTPSKQAQVSPEMQALMQRMAQLEKRQAETEAKLAQTQKELAATQAELANSKKQLAAKDAEIAALKEKLAAYEQGKQPPVQQPETKDVKTAQVVSQESEKVATVHTPKVETPQVAPKAPEQPAVVNTPKVNIPQLTLQDPEKPAAVNTPKVETPKVVVSPAPSAQKPQEKASEKTVIRDLNTLEAQSQTGEVVARLEEAKTNTNDAETRAIMDVVQQWYQTPVEKRQGDLNDLIRTSKDVEAAKAIDKAIDDGYDENTGLHKKVIELKDTVDKETVLANRERLIDKAYADLSERRPDLFEQMKLSHNKKGEAVLSIGELKVQRNPENKFAPDPADELKFSAAKSRSKSKLEEVFKRYNLSQTDKRDLRIILTYFDEQTKAQNNSKKQVVSKIKNKSSER